MTPTPQDNAVNKIKGPCLVKAGAGTGKTTTIVRKVVKLVDEVKVNPNEILCLTFSIEATNNLRAKVEEKLKNASDVTISTFHSFCAEILREEGHRIGISPDFEILLPDDAKVLLYQNMEISPYYVDQYISSISVAKDLGITVEQVEEYVNTLKEALGEVDIETEVSKLTFELKTLHLQPSETVDERRVTRLRKKEITAFLDKHAQYKKFFDMVEAWKKYDALKKESNLKDFSDLNVDLLSLFRQYDLEKITKRFKYVIVDEFQDTNKLQFELIEFIAQENITVVGDPNQSIYGFRGAYRDIFEHFIKAFKVKKTDIFTLDKSFRSPNTVLRTAHKLIKNNYKEEEECVLLTSGYDIEGDKVQALEMKNGDEEARRISEEVEKAITDEVPLDQICILFRTHKQGKAIKQALESKNIPVISAGKTDLMQKPEIRTTIAYLSILNNVIERTGTGEQAWWDLFHYHNALTPEDSLNIGRYLKTKRDEGISVDDALLNHMDDIKISSEGKKIISRVIARLSELVKKANKTLPDLVLDIYELVGLNREFSHTRSVRNVEALMNLKHFYDLSEKFFKMHGRQLPKFIAYLEILDVLGVNVSAAQIKDVNAVRLMTIHAVKGLEFDKVFVTNLASERFPISRTMHEPIIPKHLVPGIKEYLSSLGEVSEDEEDKAIKEYEKGVLLLEERRLCYVAYTRAKKNLILTYARSYNKDEDSTSSSAFLDEISFTSNVDIDYVKDVDEKCSIFSPTSRFEQFKSLLKKQFIESLDVEDLKNLFSRLVMYHAVREGEIPDLSSIKIDKLVDSEEMKKNIAINISHKSGLKFNPENFTFSPSALLEYKDCPKKYELKNIFQMPERGAFGWSAASTGTFVHDLFEYGVKNGFKTKEEFLKKASKMALEADRHGVDLESVTPLIDIFWERNKGKYSEKSKCEEWLNVKIGDFKFTGKYDRIDYLSPTEVEVVDYKTNKDVIPAEKRAIQLGFYAIGVQEKYGVIPLKLTLDMLKLDKPFTVELVDGEYMAGRSKGFNLEEVREMLKETAQAIVDNYEGEFKVAETDAPCKFCGMKFYCPKWGE